jgi:hypothetical protein
MANAKSPSCCSQNRRPTHDFSLRRPHSCSSLATTLLAIDLGTLRMFTAGHSLVTGRSSFSVPCTFRPRTSLFFSHLFRLLFFHLVSTSFKHSVVAILSYVISSSVFSGELPRCGIWDNEYHYLRLSETAGEDCRAELARAAQKRVYSVLIMKAAVRWENVHSGHRELRPASMSTSMRSVGVHWTRQG